jgi:methyl-accepting chemotaxis protein
MLSTKGWVKMSKIKNKLLLAFVLVALLPLLSVGAYGIYTITNTVKANSISKLNNKVSLVSSKVGDFLKNVTDDLFYLKDSTTLTDIINANPEGALTQMTALENDFLAFSKNKKIYHQIRYLNADGKEVVRVNRDNNQSYVVPRNKLQNKKSRYYFADTAALPEGGLMISPLDLNREKGQIEKPIRPVIRYGTPVFDRNKQLKGIVLFNVVASKFLSIVRDNVEENEQLVFIDNDGFYYTHSDTEKEWGSKADKDTGENFKKDFPQVAAKIISGQNTGTIPQQDNIISTAPVFLDSDGINRLGAIVDIVPNSVVFEAAKQFQNLFLIIGLLVLVITLAISVLLAGSITKPLIYLTKATEKMSKGDLKTVIAVDSKDETGQLAEGIERLRKSMNIFIGRLTKK